MTLVTFLAKTKIWNVLLVISAVIILGYVGGFAVLLLLILYIIYRLWSRRELWWTPFQDLVEINMYGCRWRDMTQEEKNAWRRKKKVITFRGKQLFRVPGRSGKKQKNSD